MKISFVQETLQTQYISNYEPYLAINVLIVAESNASVLNNDNLNLLYVGEIVFSAFPDTPKYMLKCDGSEILISEYQSLYNVIGNLYGTPSNASYFVLPDATKNALLYSKNLNNSDNSYTPYGGNIYVNDLNQVPSHSHETKTVQKQFWT